jgi:hypothetical protein
MLISIEKSRGMTISVYDVAELFSNNTEEYNDIQTIDYWYNELSYNDTILNLSSFQTEINDISNRIGTPYIAFTGIRAEKIIKDKSVLAYSIVLPFFIPFIAAYVFTPAHRIYYFFDVYDTSTGRLVYSEVQIMKSKDHEQNIKKLIYNTCNNLIK